ncbi:MAG: ABC transporter ATP-binding protein/permease [Methanomassiliicoccaceae archaeon]|jgi:ATP-binding cassette subfamily B protein|nr:ABC transporter ATP-binding protein/permease [Methanomassiliicoccaceae archaeon]
MSKGPKEETRLPRGGPMAGGMVAEKPKEFKKTWGKLFRYSKAYMLAVIIALAFAALGAVLQIIGAVKLGDLADVMFDQLFTGIDMGTITGMGIMLIALYIGASALTFLLNWIMATVTQRISRRMRSDISKKINRLPFSYFNKNSYGDVLSRVTNDVDTISMTLNQSLGTIVSAACLFIGSLIMMIWTNWMLALTAVGTSIIGFLLMMLIMNKSQKFFIAQQKELGDINGHIEETYTGHNVVKVYNAGKEFKRTFERTNEQLYDSAWKSQFFSGFMMPLMMFIGNLGYLAVFVVGAVLTLDGVITYGIIITFVIYVRFFSQSLSQFGQSAANLQRTAAASERVFGFIEEKEMDDESGKTKRLADVKGFVEFRNVRFGYDPDKTVINNFSANVRAGQKIAIVGPTGAGKTTMVNLLMRFYDIDDGTITLDGIPINEVPRESVHEQFCMVLQDTWLFEGTIKENIIYSKPNVSDDDVANACKMVGLHHFIQTLPEGYDTVLNDRASLSEGQKQLLTIARAIIKDSPLLILDEATSSVDTRTERIVQDAMDVLTRGRTSFIIAHRLSTIKNADMILVMKDGDIIESGSHTELLDRKGFYAELYNSQFETA